MTIQNLYTQYLDGKITQQKFLYEARRDQNLTMISPNNSFNDVVKILKNKSIISEKAHKESTGKQEVEIIAKTIDMVNPYEYSRGMDYELGIMDIPATSGDISGENIAKAQKKVLTNLTKNPQYYCDKVHGKGEVSDEWVEITKKEMDKIGKGKEAKGLIREGVEVGDKKTFNGEEVTITRIVGDRVYIKPTDYPGRAEEWVKLIDLKENNPSISKREIVQALIPLAANKEEIKQYMQSLSKSGDKFDIVDDYVEDFKNYIADKSLEENIHNTASMGGVVGGRNYSKEAQEDKEASLEVRDLIKSGISKEEAISKISNKYRLRPEYLKRKYTLYTNDDTSLEENINEQHFDDLEAAKEYARKESEQGYVQHVNKHPRGGYRVEDWLDGNDTVSSYEGGRILEDTHNIEEHGEYFDRVSDVNIDQSLLEEKRLRIYEKYAQKYNKTVDEVKCMVDEAIALKDKAGNIQYAKDSTEASTIEKNAKTKGITLTKTTV